jgi:hypothetical protein
MMRSTTTVDLTEFSRREPEQRLDIKSNFDKPKRRKKKHSSISPSNGCASLSTSKLIKTERARRVTPTAFRTRDKKIKEMTMKTMALYKKSKSKINKKPHH